MYRLFLIFVLLLLPTKAFAEGQATPATSPQVAEMDAKESSNQVNLKGNIVVYKLQTSAGNPWKSIRGSWAIFDVVNGQSVVIKHTTQQINQWTLYSKWWDHEVISVRACRLNKEGWEDSSSCINGNGNMVKIPENDSIFNYAFDFKWKENGAIQSSRIIIDPKSKPTNIRSME
jgi:hypothetical protein